MPKKYQLPEMPYDFSALEPYISGQIMQLHYEKHHNTYVTKLNEALEQYEEAQNNQDLPKIETLLSAIKFNGGGHINHSIFWNNLAPQNEGGGEPPNGPLAQRINQKYGSLDKFIEKFNAKTAAIQGSGWGWLGYRKEDDELSIVTCSNQDPLIVTGFQPLLGIDVWEHAYYLQYKNVRPDYLKAIWNVVNWKDVEKRFKEASAKEAAAVV